MYSHLTDGALYLQEPKGFCFVEFHDERDAHDALEAMDRKTLDEREVCTA